MMDRKPPGCSLNNARRLRRFQQASLVVGNAKKSPCLLTGGPNPLAASTRSSLNIRHIPPDQLLAAVRIEMPTIDFQLHILPEHPLRRVANLLCGVINWLANAMRTIFQKASSLYHRENPLPAPTVINSTELERVPQKVSPGKQYYRDLQRACQEGLIVNLNGEEAEAVIFRDQSRFAHFYTELGEYHFRFSSITVDTNRCLSQTASALWGKILASAKASVCAFDAGAGTGFTAFDMYEAGQTSGKPCEIETTGLSPIDPFMPTGRLLQAVTAQEPLYDTDLLEKPFIKRQFIGNFLKLDIDAHLLRGRYSFIHDSMGAVLYLLLGQKEAIIDKVIDMLSPGGIFYMTFLRADLVHILQRPAVKNGCIVGIRAKDNGYEVAIRKCAASGINRVGQIYRTDNLVDLLF